MGIWLFAMHPPLGASPQEIAKYEHVRATDERCMMSLALFVAGCFVAMFATLIIAALAN